MVSFWPRVILERRVRHKAIISLFFSHGTYSILTNFTLLIPTIAVPSWRVGVCLNYPFIRCSVHNSFGRVTISLFIGTDHCSTHLWFLVQNWFFSPSCTKSYMRYSLISPPIIFKTPNSFSLIIKKSLKEDPIIADYLI